MSRYKKITLITGGIIILILILFFVLRSKPSSTVKRPFDNQPEAITVQPNTPSVNIDFEEIEKRDPDKVSTEEAQAIQSEADRQFSLWQEAIYKNYPWYESLPLHTEQYFVYLDLSKKTIVGVLYQNKIPTEQTETVKNSIIESLRTLNVDQALLGNVSWEIE